MKVFVAGAGGVLGRHLLPRLVAAGHEVIGTTRSHSRLAEIEAPGARGVVMDALDSDGVKRAVRDARPDALIHALTALPPRGPVKLRDLDATNRLREEGTGTLVAAARAAGVDRLVAESFVGVYGLGADGVLTEESPLPDVPEQGSAAVGALRSLEAQVLAIGGICLRFGLFYGPNVPSTQAQVRSLRRRTLPMPGGGPGVASFVHVDDAAAATVAALERGRAGEVYNVVDDEPVSFGDFFGEMAAAIGVPRPMRVPVWLGRLVAPYATDLAVRSHLRISNRKLREELGWEPAYPTYRAGLAGLALAG